MKSSTRTGLWFFLIGLVCLAMLSCQFTQTVLEQASATPPPTDTPLPPPTDTPTQPPPTPTDTPLPSPTATATTIPSPTIPPSPTEIPATNTPALSIVTVVNNLNQPISISISGPANKTFQVRAKSTYTFETPPGRYTYKFEARNFYPQTGYVTFNPGPFTWNWGKASP